jgi:hypothetical protein
MISMARKVPMACDTSIYYASARYDENESDTYESYDLFNISIMML